MVKERALVLQQQTTTTRTHKLLPTFSQPLAPVCFLLDLYASSWTCVYFLLGQQISLKRDIVPVHSQLLDVLFQRQQGYRESAVRDLQINCLLLLQYVQFCKVPAQSKLVFHHHIFYEQWKPLLTGTPELQQHHVTEWTLHSDCISVYIVH